MSHSEKTDQSIETSPNISQLLEVAEKDIKTVLTGSHIKQRNEVKLIDLKRQLLKKEVISSWTRATIIVHKIIRYIRKSTLMWKDPKKFLWDCLGRTKILL